MYAADTTNNTSAKPKLLWRPSEHTNYKKGEANHTESRNVKFKTTKIYYKTHKKIRFQLPIMMCQGNK